MKLKNYDPGKIWAKSDNPFKSYGQKVVKNADLCISSTRFWVPAPVRITRAGTRDPSQAYYPLPVPDTRVFGQFDTRYPGIKIGGYLQSLLMML